jgi:hypothetical protein
MKDPEIYLDTYVLQQDMRIRLPKAVLSNMKIEKGKTKFDIFLNSENNSLILKVQEGNGETDNGR